MTAIVNNIGFVMDAGILILLAATVALAFKLTLSFRTFKDSRAEMAALIATLSENVDACEKAVTGMQAAARKTSLELDELIGDAKKIAGELQVMTGSGDALAARLERLAEKNAVSVPVIAPVAMPSTERIVASDVTPVRHNFTIYGREDYDMQEDGSLSGGLQSRAERELFEALQGGDHAKTAGRAS